MARPRIELGTRGFSVRNRHHRGNVRKSLIPLQLPKRQRLAEIPTPSDSSNFKQLRATSLPRECHGARLNRVPFGGLTDAAGARSFAYDDALRLAAETNALAVISRSYDSLGRMIGFALDGGYQTDYAYDGLGRISSVAWAGAAGAYTGLYAYAENSDMISGHDIGAGADTFRTRKTFEADRNLISSVSNLWNSAAVSFYQYANDSVGRRVERIDSSSVTNAFGYNDRSELVSALMVTNAYGYAYDPIGNRESATSNVEVLEYLANELNQYTNIADGVTNTPTHDTDGNLLTYGGWTFAWNAENRLALASNGSTVVEYAYDYMGRRVRKVAAGVTNEFVYDGWALIREMDGSSTNDYAYGADLSGSMQGAGTIGGLLLADLGGTVAFYCYDANGNVTELVDASGSNVASYIYGPFGGTIAQTGALADDNPYRFSSKYLDEEATLYYYGHRYYSPGLGRWMSMDPLAQVSGPNLHSYCYNSPIGKTDFLGLLSAWEKCDWMRKKMPEWKPTGYPNIDKYLKELKARRCRLKLECLRCCPTDWFPGQTGDAAPHKEYPRKGACRIRICTEHMDGWDEFDAPFLKELVHCCGAPAATGP